MTESRSLEVDPKDCLQRALASAREKWFRLVRRKHFDLLMFAAWMMIYFSSSHRHPFPLFVAGMNLASWLLGFTIRRKNALLAKNVELLEKIKAQMEDPDMVFMTKSELEEQLLRRGIRVNVGSPKPSQVTR